MSVQIQNLFEIKASQSLYQINNGKYFRVNFQALIAEIKVDKFLPNWGEGWLWKVKIAFSFIDHENFFLWKNSKQLRQKLLYFLVSSKYFKF